MLLYPYWWDVNIGSGNGFVSPGKKKAITWANITQMYVYIWRQ